MNFQRSLRTTIVIMCLSTQAGQPGAWTRIILERVKKKKKKRSKRRKSRGERSDERGRAEKREREKRIKRGGGAREMEGERIQWRLKGCFAREDPISRSTSNQWPAERLVSGTGEGRGSEEREEEGYWSDELRKNRPNESTARSRAEGTLYPLPLSRSALEKNKERERNIYIYIYTSLVAVNNCSSRLVSWKSKYLAPWETTMEIPWIGSVVPRVWKKGLFQPRRVNEEILQFPAIWLIFWK